MSAEALDGFRDTPVPEAVGRPRPMTGTPRTSAHSLHQTETGSPSLVIWVLVVSVAVVAIGMVYSLWWAPVVRHQEYWITPGDIWYSVRTAHWIGWGSLSFVYSNAQSELITLPGFEVLLTPFVVLSSALGLSENAPGLLPNLHPQAWLLIGPVSMASGGLALWAFDSMARHMRVPTTRRKILLVLEAGAIFPAVALWGHPEDVLATGFFVLALRKLLEGREAAAGWLLGAAIAFQLFAVFAVPVLLAVVGLRKGATLLARAAMLPGFLFVAVAIPDFHDSVRTLLQQPTPPAVNHATPWVGLSPKLSHGNVAGGPTRTIGLLVAVGAGVWARARRQDPARLLWLLAVALAARCVFDPVMTPYYVMPCVALALVAGSGNRPVRFILGAMAGTGLTVMAFSHHGDWAYWLMMTGIIAALLGTVWPTKRPRPQEEQPDVAPVAGLTVPEPVTAGVGT
ncbi:MAG: hypothetical protein ABSC30_01635 [Acidimicrobiales bacterium]